MQAKKVVNQSKSLSRPPDESVSWKIIFFISHPKHMLWVLKRTVSLSYYFLYYSSKTYVVGTQKNRLIEAVLLSTQNTCLNNLVRK